MTALADVFISARVDTSRFGSDIKSGMNSRGVSQSMDSSGKQAGSKFSGAFKNALKIGGAVAAAGIAAGGVKFFKGAIEEATEARKVGAQTAAVLKSTGDQAGITAKGIGALSTAISNKTAIDDEQVQSAANMLLTFKNIRNEAGKGNDIFSQTTQLVTDMSTAMGTDTKGSAILLGKALNDPVKGLSALTRVGVQFTDQQKAINKALVEGGVLNALAANGQQVTATQFAKLQKDNNTTTQETIELLTGPMSKAQQKLFDHYEEGGHAMEAQKNILKELNSQFKGSAEAQATPAEKAAIAWANFKEEIGTAVLPMLDRLATWFTKDGLPAIRDLAAGFDKNFMPTIKSVAKFIAGDVVPALKDMGQWIGRNSDWIVPLVGALAAGIGVFKAIAAVTKVWAAAQVILNIALTANPIGLVIAALAALGVGLFIAWKKSETFRRIVTAGFTEVKNGVQKASLFVADKILWMAEKMVNAMAIAFSWVPGLGKKIGVAKEAISGLREHLNREMDKMNDEDVNIKIKTSTLNAALDFVQKGSTPSGGAGGAGGPIPRAMAAVGGAGSLNLRANTQGALAGIDEATSSAQRTASLIATEMAKDAKAAAAMGLGPAGKAGRILPPGSYSIGMPYHGYPGHNGADYPAPEGTPVYAPWDGRVTYSGFITRADGSPSFGNTVKIAYANGMTSLFAHLSERIGGTGPVGAGTMVGRVGSTGNSTGNHLHAEFNGGSINPASLGIFDRGGIMRGLGINLSGKPERVLSPRQTQNFERLTDALERQNTRGGGPAIIKVYDVDGRLMGSMRGEIDADRRFGRTLSNQGAGRP